MESILDSDLTSYLDHLDEQYGKRGTDTREMFEDGFEAFKNNIMLQDLIRYTELADQKIIDTFLNTHLALPQAEALFSHILNAQHIWISRIKNNQPEFERFTIHSKEAFETLHNTNIEELKEILNSTDLTKVISYTTSTGESFENTVADILLHVVNHSTYHRGQVASQFKLNDVVPPVTDYVFLKRQGEF